MIKNAGSKSNSNVYARYTASMVFRCFAGKNNYVAADNGGSAWSQEINRTTLSSQEIKEKD
jgi:hypothetical protein